MNWLLEPQTWIAFATLVALELVLGIDNVVFITILASKLPPEQHQKARVTGLSLAIISRILLLLSLTWIMQLTKPIFTISSISISGRDIILFIGGIFLLAKATFEIHSKLEGEEGHASARVKPSFINVIVQILLLDVVFSLDSVITAVGMANRVEIMIAAVVIAALTMIVFVGPVGNFVERHPTVKMLALAFLLLIGFTLVVESLHQHIPKGYIYFAMAFSIFVEMLNLRLRKTTKPVSLHEPYAQGDEEKLPEV